jgi:hypothetical protein
MPLRIVVLKMATQNPKDAVRWGTKGLNGAHAVVADVEVNVLPCIT